MKIAIVGRRADTKNYVKYVQGAGITPLVTMHPREVAVCDGLLLPGGGDITPAFFGEKNHGSGNIDTELDIIQLQSFDLALHKHIPVLGICKGLQIINVGLGGTLYQDLPTSHIHRYLDGDQYHDTQIISDTWLHGLYGGSAKVNSAHHQALKKLGTGLYAVQYCFLDNCIEAISHRSLPILGVQWHPERLDETKSNISGQGVLTYFVSLLSAGKEAAR